MKITVIGAGAVGGYFGGRLAEAGVDVTFLVREKRAKQLNQTGLRIKSPFGDCTVQPHLAKESSEIDGCDLVILAVKNYHLENTIPRLKPLVASGAKILPLLNGVEHFDLLTNEFGAETVLGGLCQIISTLDAEGTILHTNKLHRIIFGPKIPSQSGFCQELEQVLKSAKMEVTLSSNIQQDIWVKYAFITAYSGITTASRLPIDQILKTEATKQVYVDTLQEMWQLAKASGTKLPDDYVDKNVQWSLAFQAGSTSSMHQDFRKGLSLEVESLQGGALRLANKHRVALPTIKVLYALIKPFETGSVQ